MRLSPALLSFLVLSAAALVAAVLLASTAPEKRCASADSSMDRSLVTQAQSEYAAVRKADPAEACAGKGMLRVTHARCQRANRLLRTGAKDEARTTYVAILNAETPETDPSVGCAISGLGKLGLG